jgi:alpha-D-ribose 1-methylphosphonate 5-triphosphate diphosphatase
MHGDMIESEIEPRPGAEFPLDLAVFELDKRLAANGVTTAYAAISFWEPETESRKHVRSGERARQTAAAVNALRDALLVDLRVHARYEVTTPSVAPALNDLLTRGQVHLLSLMDHTPGQGQYRDLERYIQFIAKWRNTHPAQIEAETHDRIRRAQSMPSIWHTASELVALAHAHGLPIASHDDDTPAKIDAMADFAVTISEFPVTLEAAQEAQRRGLRVAMGAPNVVRGGSHSGNLSALEAIKAGVVDMLAADYSPAALLQAAFALVDHGLLPLHEAAKLLSQNVAAALGLHDRGSIAIGKSADLVLAQGAVRPRVRGTLRRGVPIYWDGSMMHRTGMQVQSEKQKETTLYGAHD